MSYTYAFRTRSEIAACKNLPIEGVALCALDIGYSAVKGFSATTRACIPSYVREHPEPLIGTPRPTDIFYRDESGTVYAVGSLAMDSISSKDTNDASNVLYTRNRYFSPSFLILARVGMAVELGDEANHLPIFLQTGLPPAYRKSDTSLLKEALAGEHKFSVKVGGGPWKDYAFTLDPANIAVMDQPIGSVYSASKRGDGSTVRCDDGKSYIDHNLLVLDGGFGTLDVFSISNRSITGSNTFNDLGMRAIFDKAAEQIYLQYGKEVHIHTMQQYLTKGAISIFDRKTRSTQVVDINDIFRNANQFVCEKAMTKIESAYDNLEDYDFLLVTGGTGSAWLEMLRDRYKGMSTLSVISANQNEKISSVYSNVRGYYIYRALALGKQ